MSAFVKIPASKRSMARRGLVCGIGVNDSDYKTSNLINGIEVRCPAYMRWKHMLKRCYSKKFQESRPTYIGCYVCEEWLTFSNFERWFNENNVDGYQLDKDIIKNGNKCYSPSKCLFVPSAINSLLVDCRARRGEFPIGVCADKRRGNYIAQIAIDSKRKSIGSFLTPEDAHNAYVSAKNSEILRKCDQYPEFAKYLINHLLTIEESK